MGDGCVCTVTGSSMCFLCTYCDAVIVECLVSGMPDNVCPFPRTTKKLQTFVCFYVLFLFYTCLIVFMLISYTFLA